jgi:hypothetical protein
MSGSSPLPANFPTKLAAWDPQQGWIPIQYEDVYKRQTISGVHRVVIASKQNGIDLLRNLLHHYSGPFQLIYMLVTPPEGYEPMRYELEGLEKEEVEEFLSQYRDFLSTDARHHVWIHARTSGGTLIYDEHDWIYAYGAQEAVTQWLIENDFSESLPEIPFPHLHNENAANDQAMTELLRALPWKVASVSNIG